MKFISIGAGGSAYSPLILGCMRIRTLDDAAVDRLVMTALENQINFFDHADCYADGDCEARFGRVLKNHPSLRDQIVLQTKVGICNGYFDFSTEHILEAVDGSLRRLQTDHLDFLLLHRPDTLVEPEQVAEAFQRLYNSGKVAHFGVSNQNPMQIELLRQYVGRPLVINQLQLSLASAGMIAAGLNVNMENRESVMHDGGILEYSRLHQMTIQAWSPFQYGFFEGVFLGSDKYPALNAKLQEIADEKGVTPDAVAVAWILRHPAAMQVILGTTRPDRIVTAAKAVDISLTRAEWYALYRAAGYQLP